MPAVELIEKQPHNRFRFSCVLGCSACCSDNDIVLYPFDVIELCEHLRIDSTKFLKAHARFAYDSEKKVMRCLLRTSPCCTFFSKGCTVHEARPISCRAYPVARYFEAGNIKYFLPKTECIGFGRGHKQSVAEWLDAEGVCEKDHLVQAWNSFLQDMPRCDKSEQQTVFNLLFTKIFYDFNSGILQGLEKEFSASGLETKMQILYGLSSSLLADFSRLSSEFESFAQKQGPG